MARVTDKSTDRQTDLLSIHFAKRIPV